jgi:hypothetical protein
MAMKRNTLFLYLVTMIGNITIRPMTCIATCKEYGWGVKGMEKLESRTNERIRIRNKEYTQFDPQQESNAAIIAAHKLTTQQKQQIDAILGKESVIRALTIWRHSPYSSLQYCYASYMCWKYGISFQRNLNNYGTFYKDWSLWRKLDYPWPDRRVFTIQDMPYYFKMGDPNHHLIHRDENNFNRLVNADTIREQASIDNVPVSVPHKWYYPIQQFNNIPQSAAPPFLVVAEAIDLTDTKPLKEYDDSAQWIKNKMLIKDVNDNGNIRKFPNGALIILDTEF